MPVMGDFGYILRKRYRRMMFVPNENVLRVALLVFSICFGILSISLMALGVAYTEELKWPKPYIGLDFMELPTWVIILGVVSLVLSFVGCFCAKCYNRTIYILFGVVLCLVLCFEMTIAIVAFQNKSESKRLKTEMLIQQHHKINGTDYLKTIEEHYQCCGISGEEEICRNKSTSPVVVGCVNKVNTILDNVANGIGYSAVVLSLLQIIQIISVYSICVVTI